jgi:multidrug efflux pump subunit AcrA (membrane-fusion protein)
LLDVDAGMRIVGTVRPADRSEELPVGAAVSARMETFSAPVSATIDSISPRLDQATGRIVIDAKLANVEGGLRAGLAAWVDAP